MNTMRSSLLHIMVMFLAAMDTRAQMGLQERMDSRVCLDCREPRVQMVKMDKMAQMRRFEIFCLIKH